MRVLPLNYVAPGAVLNSLILDRSCRVLMRPPLMLTENHIENIKRFEYQSIYIEDPLQLEMEPIISEELWISGLKTIKANFDVFYALNNSRKMAKLPKSSFHESKLKDNQLNKLVALSEHIVSALNKRGPKPIGIVDIKSDKLYPYQHALNTGILAVSIGLQLDLKYVELKSLFLASVAIEIGNLSIPTEILYKRGKLTEEEFGIIKQHAYISLQEIKSSSELNLLVKTICIEHHERMDGSGYPNGLDRSSIHRLTRIVSLCDAYDAMTSDRSYRPAYPPYKALQSLEKLVDIAYDPLVMSKLKKTILPYPPGTCLTTSEGAICIKSAADSGLISYIRLQTGTEAVKPAEDITVACVNYQATYNVCPLVR